MIRSVCTTLALLATAALSAADFTGGAQVGAAFPLSDLKTLTDKSITGYGFLFGRCDLGNGHNLRAKLDYSSVSGHPSSSSDLPSLLGSKASSTGFAVDYLYYLDQTSAHGVYFGAGLGVARQQVQLSNPVTGASVSSTATSGLGELNVGYQFNHNWNVELCQVQQQRRG
jgi:hypothetical protein